MEVIFRAEVRVIMSSLFNPNANNLRLKISLACAGAYIVICSTYILLSDLLAHEIAVSYEHFYQIQLLKGFAFVFVTGLALFSLLYVGLGQFLKAKEIIRLQKQAVLLSENRALMGLLSSATLHDSNNILMIIHMNLEALESDSQLSQESRRALDKVHSALEELLDTTRSLLQYTKEACQDEELQEGLVKPAILQSWSLVSHFCKDKKVHFSFHSETEGLRALMMGSRLKQALMNLLLNAIQAVDDGGSIEVLLRSTPEETLIEIHDTGPGVDPEDRYKIFHPNFSTKKEGTGLGLLSAKLCIESQQGRLEVGSSHLAGACFRIRLKKS